MTDKPSPKPDRTPLSGVKPSSGPKTSTISAEFPVVGDVTLDKEWIVGQSTDVLVNLMVNIALEIKTRKGSGTEQISGDSGDLKFPDLNAADVKEFTRLPAHPQGSMLASARKGWRIIFSSSNPKHKPTGVEIVGDTVVGRGESSGAKPDLDLSAFDADEFGVSRRHAMFKPSGKELLLIDLGSTNGTKVNEKPVTLGGPGAIKDGDTLSFGGLHLKVKIVKPPETDTL